MRHLRSALYKDLKLFFSRAGLLSLALPLLLLPLLLFGMGNLSENAFVRPFPIAVRDEDQTLMSASLISQIRHVELFSEVLVLDDTVSDPEALADGAAAVVTVPEDFFYDLYLMKECPVTVTLNGSMPLEASLFEAVLNSVMEIIRADHAAGQGVYAFCYGTPTVQQQNAMYEQTGMTLVKDALGRQMVFSGSAAASDTGAALIRRLCATMLFVLAFFFSMAAVRTVPEELSLGIIPRLKAAGGSSFAFLFSKYLTAFLLTLPTLAAICLVLPDRELPRLLLLHCLQLFAAFGLQLALARWTKNSTATQRLGNLILLPCLILGGTLWPRQMLPQPLFFLSRITLPYYGMLGLEAIHREVPMLPLIWPLPLMGCLGILLSTEGRRLKPARTVSGTGRDAQPRRLHTAIRRMLGIGRMKVRSMVGGSAGFAAMAVILILCGTAAYAAQSGAATLRLAICDLDQSDASEALIEALSHTEGLSVSVTSHAEGAYRLMLGEAEGLFTIGEGYEDQLSTEKELPVTYDSASGTVTAQGCREVIAGRIMSQKARLRAIEQAREILGADLSEDDTAQLLQIIDRYAEQAPALYHVTTQDGSALSDAFVPDQMAFCIMAILFVLLTAAPWCGSRDARAAAVRLRSMPFGRVLSLGSDCGALFALGFLAGLCTLLPSGLQPCLQRLPALAACSYCFGAMALFLTRLSVLEGRIDGLAPMIALGLCLLGGCFLNLSQFSPQLRILTLLTPTGLTMEAAKGSPAAGAALLLVGTVFLLSSIPCKRSVRA